MQAAVADGEEAAELVVEVEVAVAGEVVAVAGVAVENRAPPDGEHPGTVLAPATCPAD